MAGTYENQDPQAQTVADVQHGLAVSGSAVGQSQSDAHGFIVTQAPGGGSHGQVGGHQSPGGSQGQTDARVFG